MYSRSDLAKQTTPVATQLDVKISVTKSGLGFLQLGLIFGGLEWCSWRYPSNTFSYTHISREKTTTTATTTTTTTTTTTATTRVNREGCRVLKQIFCSAAALCGSQCCFKCPSCRAADCTVRPQWRRICARRRMLYSLRSCLDEHGS